MCGIFAACNFSGGLTTCLAQRAIDRMRHRGPDGLGVWCDSSGTACMSHARLGLVGIDNSVQPISSESGMIHAIVNGEFYGHAALRKKLKSLGHCFSTDSDSEILIHLYEQNGLECLHELRGEFAFVLWDAQRAQMIAVRDRFGVKPLVYAFDGRSLLVASEAKALLAELDVVDWDDEAFFAASAMQYTPINRTLFRNIRQLPPGHLLTFREGDLQTICYWDLNFPISTAARADGAASQHLSEAIEQTQRRLMDAIQVRLQTDLPVCFHLSGGIDSSAVLGIASRVSGQAQHAFTLCFEDKGYDESAIARETAEYCQAVWHPVTVRRNDVLRALNDAVIASEGLAINGHLSAKYLLNQEIHRCGFKAVLGGEGADELFAGYAHLRMDYWRGSHHQFDADQLTATNVSQVGMMLPAGTGLPLVALQTNLGYEPAFLQAKATLGCRLRSLIDDHWLHKWSGRDAFAELLTDRQFRLQLEGRSQLHQSTLLWTKLALAGYIFRTLGDGTEMPWSVEGRVPLADHLLFEYVRQLPVEWLIHNRTEKYILREAVRPFVTSTVYARPKHPLDSPPLLTGDQTSFDEIRDRLLSEEFDKQPFFSRRKVRDLLTALPTWSSDQRQVWDPVLMIVMSTLAMQSLLTSPLTRIS